MPRAGKGQSDYLVRVACSNLTVRSEHPLNAFERATMLLFPYPSEESRWQGGTTFGWDGSVSLGLWTELFKSFVRRVLKSP